MFDLLRKSLTPFYAPEAGAAEPELDPGAADPTPESEPTPAPEFDASAVNIEDPDAMGSLTDEQLEAVTKYSVEHPSGEPGPDKGTPDPVVTPSPEPTEKGADGATKYAGKYATTDDLVKGVTEIAKALGTDATAFIEAAKASGEFKSLESLYKSFERTLSAKGATPTSPAKPAADPSQGTPLPETFNPNDPQVESAVDRLTFQQLAGSNIVKRMQAAGLDVPKNMEEFDSLAQLNPYYATEFATAYRELYRANVDEAKGYFEAAKTHVSANASVVDADVQAIKQFATDKGLKVSDDEIEAVKQAALAKAYNFDSRYGHKFLRAGSVKEHFFATLLPAKIDELRLQSTVAGRTQAVKDLDRASRREIVSLSTSKTGSRERALQVMPDINDPAVLESLPDEALNDPEKWFRSQGFVKRK